MCSQRRCIRGCAQNSWQRVFRVFVLIGILECKCLTFSRFEPEKYFSVLHATQHSAQSVVECGCVSLYRGFPKLTLESLQQQSESKIN